MDNKKNLICFIGLKQTGKGYNSEFYIQKGFLKISLADPLRDMLWNIIGFGPTKEIPYNEYKKCILTTEIKTKKFGFIPWLEEIKITTIRNMMQNLGSVMKKYFGQDFWSNLWAKNVLDANCDVVCDDIRFTYEVKKALSFKRKGYDVRFIWVCYDKANFKEILKDSHESEALAQYIYYNQDKYNLHDLCEIKEKTLKQIIEDFEKDE